MTGGMKERDLTQGMDAAGLSRYFHIRTEPLRVLPTNVHTKQVEFNNLSTNADIDLANYTLG